MANTSPRDDRFILLPWEVSSKDAYVRRNKRWNHPICIVLRGGNDMYSIFVYNLHDKNIDHEQDPFDSLNEAKDAADKLATAIGFKCLKDKHRSML